MDKLKKNKTLFSLVIISIVAFLFGIFFIIIINKTDKELVQKYIETFINEIYKNDLNYIKILNETLKSNIFIIILIWSLGISIVGIPIIIIIYFFKLFSLGFIISCFIYTYKTKGIIYSLLYIFPNEIIKYFCYTLLIFNAFNLSKKLITSIIKLENLNFKTFTIKYIKIIIICLFIITLTSLYEVYGIPFVFNKFYFLIK